MRDYTRTEIESIIDKKYTKSYYEYIIHDEPIYFKNKRKFKIERKGSEMHIWYKHKQQNIWTMRLHGDTYELD